MAHKLYLNVGAGANRGDVGGRAGRDAGVGAPRPLSRVRTVGGQRKLLADAGLYDDLSCNWAAELLLDIIRITTSDRATGGMFNSVKQHCRAELYELVEVI